MSGETAPARDRTHDDRDGAPAGTSPARPPRPDRPAPSTGSALREAVRAAGRFDRASISLAAGLLAAIPVAALLGGGLIAGNRVAAVTMGAGAMLVGVAWRTRGGRPPLGLMAGDAALMAFSTLVGCVTGADLWAHALVLCLWGLMAGLLVAIGPRGGVLGTQAIIAVVVFGRFSEPAGQALGLAGYVLAGGLAQVVFLSLVRWPPPLRGQRRATAAAYRALAALATAGPRASTLPAATALDDAMDSLSGGALLGDPAILTLRTLVSEGHRTRVQLSALQSLLARAGAGRATAEQVLVLAGTALEQAARAIEGDARAAPILARTVKEISGRAAEPPDVDGPIGAPLSRRLAALAGQLRALEALAPAAGRGGGVRARRPQRRTRRPLDRARADLEQIRANASLASPAGRHALRLAVVVPAAQSLSQVLPLQRSYWMVVAAATVLRPEFGATFTRGTERVVGTTLGVGLAGAIAGLLHPAGGATVLLVALLAWAGYSVFPASFAIGFAFITALVVFLLNAVSPDTLATAGARLLDTLIGGALGLLVYAVWPTWARASARRSLAELAAAQREYIGQVMGALVSGRRAGEQTMRSQARRARLARTSAEATVATSLREPATRRIDAAWSQRVLTAMRRLVQAAHVLRLDAQDVRARPAMPELAPLAADLDRLLAIVELDLEGDGAAGVAVPAGRLPDLRAAYGALERRYGEDPQAAPVLGELDEIVDAAHGLAALVSGDPADAPEPP